MNGDVIIVLCRINGIVFFCREGQVKWTKKKVFVSYIECSGPIATLPPPPHSTPELVKSNFVDDALESSCVYVLKC